MSWLTGKIGSLVASIGGFLIVILFAYRKGRKSKADEVQAATTDSIIDITKKVRQNDQDVDSMSDDALNRELLNDDDSTPK